MKKNYFLIPFLLVGLHLNGQTVNPVFIGSCDNDMLSEMVLHGKYVYGIGTTNSFGASAGDIYLFKADTSGNGIWARQIGTGEDVDEGICLRINGNNEIMVSAKIPHDYGSVMFMRLDTSGNLLQSKVLNDEGCALQHMYAKSDNGFLLAGFQVTSGHYLPVVISTDEFGNINWTKTIMGDTGPDTLSGNGIGTCVMETAAGDVMVTGSIRVSNASHPFVAQLDATGNLQWYRVYNMPMLDGYGNMIATSDGNYMVCGSATRVSGPGSDPFIIKISPSGNLLYSYVYRITDSASATSLSRVRIAGNGTDFLLTGTVSLNMAGDSSDFYAIHIDQTGNIDWAKRYGNSTTNVCNSAVVTPGYFLVGGYSAENADGNAIVGHAQNDIMLMKTYMDGSSAVNTTELMMTQNSFVNDTIGNNFIVSDYVYSPSSIIANSTNVATTYDSVSCFGLSIPLLADVEGNMGLYPNPAIAYTEVVMNSLIPAFDLYIHNATGELVLSRSNILNGRTLVDVNTFSPGIYIVTARSGGEFIGSKKLVVH